MADEVKTEAQAPAQSEAVPAELTAEARTALESKVGDSLAKLDWDGIGGGDEPAEAKPAAKPAAAAKVEPAAEEGAEPSEEAEPTDEAEATPDEEGGEQEEQEKPAEQQPKGEEKPKGPTLPAAYVRSLKAYGWEDAEIESAMKADPANFMVAAGKIHKNRTEETSRWAELGRATRTQNQEGQEAPKGEQKKAAPQTRAQIKPVDVEALVEKHGNEDMVKEIVGPVNEAIAQINAVLPDLMTGVQSVQQSRQETLSKQIDQFFGGDELKTYAEFYGKDAASMQEPQIENRNKVLELADALIAGAAQQGRALTVGEAMTLAHDSVSGSFKVQAIRKQVKAAVTTRSNGITLRPSNKGARANEGGPAKSRTDLEGRTRDRLASVFGG